MSAKKETRLPSNDQDGTARVAPNNRDISVPRNGEIARQTDNRCQDGDGSVYPIHDQTAAARVVRITRDTSVPAPFDEAIYATVRLIPRGRVASYGLVAALSGHPGAARATGGALHRNPYFGDVPCHRVVMANGTLPGEFAFGGREVQAAMLEAEGVTVTDFKVDMRVFGINQ